jgi:type I restriction enzyme S subunit
MEAEIAGDLTKVEGDAVAANIPDARLGDHTSLISSGSTPRGGETVYLQKGPVMLIRSQNVQMNGLNLSDVAYITEQINDEMRRSIVQKGDVLLNINGASIGRVATFQLDGVRANVNQHVCIIRPNPGELDPEYLAYFLRSAPFQEEINHILRGGTQQALTFRQISDFLVPLPAISEQRQIANILGQAEAIRQKHVRAAETAGELVGSLVQQAFRW